MKHARTTMGNLPLVRLERRFYSPPMPTRAEILRAEAEKCQAQAKKAGSATAMFAMLELADDLLKQARQVEQEDEKPKK